MIDLTIVGGGMITNDLILPSIYQLQRSEIVGRINICSLKTRAGEKLGTAVELPYIGAISDQI